MSTSWRGVWCSHGHLEEAAGTDLMTTRHADHHCRADLNGRQAISGMQTSVACRPSVEGGPQWHADLNGEVACN
eukprot:1161125-Pelagomonas_calceolata.AAC.4